MFLVRQVMKLSKGNPGLVNDLLRRNATLQ